MRLSSFRLEDYLGKYEFKAPYLLCCSDAESFDMRELLAMAAPEHRKMWDSLRLNYTEIEGLAQLRREIADQLYPGLSMDQICCFAGAEEGIFCAFNGLVESQDHVIVLTPCYQSLSEIPQANNLEVTTIELTPQNRWRIDLDSIAQAIRANTKWLVINFPHNPSGQVITQTELDQLVNLLDKHGIWLFSDEVYRLLGQPDEPWSKPAATLYPRALSLGVTSKSFGLAGLRIGWIACQDVKALAAMARVKHYVSICNSAPSELIALIALNNKDRIIERNTAIVKDNLLLVDEFFEQNSSIFSWVRPQGGCVGFVHYKSRQPVVDLCQQLIAQKGVLLMPETIFDYSGNYFRIGFGRKNMPEALARFSEFLAGA